MKKEKRIRIRLIIQIAFFALIAIGVLNHYLIERGINIPFLSVASLHGLCPFGGVVSIYEIITKGALIKKVHESSLVILVVLLGLSILLGKVFCGWICPLGSFQEWLGRIGRKLFGKKYNNFISPKFEKFIRLIPYVVLVWVLYVTAITGKIVFDAVDPYYALFNLWTGEVGVTAIIVLILTMVGSLFVERPWCKYACPLGAILGVTNKFRIFKIKRNASSCIDCGMCTRTCPMNVKVQNVEEVKSVQCISCLECTSEFNCPKSKTLNIGR